MRHILMVGSGGRATKAFAFKTFLKVNYTITLLDEGLSPFNRMADNILFGDPYNINTFEQVKNDIVYYDSIQKIDAVLPMSEFSVSLAGIINEFLELPGLSSIIAKNTRDKITMKQAFKKNNVPTAEFYFSRNIEEAVKSATKIGYPVVLKPTDSGGSIGVSRCDNSDQLKESYNEAMAHPKVERVMVEKYIEGPEVSVESVSFDGKFIFSSVTEKMITDKYNFAEIAHIVKDPHTNNCNNLIQLAAKAVNTLGIREGIAHTEIKIGKDDMYIIETGARAAGGYIPDIVYNSMNINLYKLWVDSLTRKSNFIDRLSINYSINSAVVFFYDYLRGNNLENPYYLNLNDGVRMQDFGLYSTTTKNSDKYLSNMDRLGHIIIDSNNKNVLYNQIEKFIQGRNSYAN